MPVSDFTVEQAEVGACEPEVVPMVGHAVRLVNNKSSCTAHFREYCTTVYMRVQVALPSFFTLKSLSRAVLNFLLFAIFSGY